MPKLGVGAAFVDGKFVPGDVEVGDGRIQAVGLPPGSRDRLALPGLVDVQINGFAGVDFATGRVGVGPKLAATGVTAYQPTLISLPEDTTIAALGSAAPGIIGMHLEGPFLSPARHGAHDPANLREPDPALVERLLAAGPVTMVTLAPELPGALEMVEYLAGRGVVVSVGHSDADAETARAAFAAGATAVTHLFNAQRPLHHREPGVAGAALATEGIVMSLIVDGVHLAPDTVRMVFAAAPGRVALITDAIAAAGMPDGDYPLGDRTVHVAGGEARLDDGTLAGSVLTMDRAVRNVIDLGISPEMAVAAASTTPARLLGRTASLAPGSPADVVVVSPDYEVQRTLIAGVEVYAAQ